jgi:hypothetical protein
MRSAVLALVAGTGCLTIPPPPGTGDAADARPGGAPRFRPQVVVYDVDGDGYDELIQWGTGPRSAPTIAIHWGGASFFDPPQDLVPEVDASRPWREVLDVIVHDLDGDTMPDIAVLLAEDATVPAGPQPTDRRLYVGRFENLAGRDFDAFEHALPLEGTRAQIGGYVDAPR